MADWYQPPLYRERSDSGPGCPGTATAALHWCPDLLMADGRRTAFARIWSAVLTQTKGVEPSMRPIPQGWYSSAEARVVSSLS